jgi:tRNA (cytidine32/uridine32-2'-O)-methyltransferase
MNPEELAGTSLLAEATAGGRGPELAALSNIRIVLVETSHPGNIGAVARAMKTMRLSNLHLVRPKAFPCAEATARAAGADDVLFEAKRWESLGRALNGSGWACATSARTRSIAWPELTPREAAAKAVEMARQVPVAIVFGREQWGLTNAELDRCHSLVRIPTHPDFRSLNLAAAVQLLAYEIQVAWQVHGHTEATSGNQHSACRTDDLEGFYDHLEAALIQIGYLNPERPKRLMRRLRRFFNRSHPDRSEINILRGILTAAQRAAQTRR